MARIRLPSFACRGPSSHPSRHRAKASGLALVVAVGLVSTVMPQGAASDALPAKPFGTLVCAPKYGVRFCQGGLVDGQDRRVPSFDGVPLDADLTLPRAGHAPYPLIVLLHGLGGTKVVFESTSDNGMVNNVTLASEGWAVLTYTARGFGGSCGTPASRAFTPACAKGWLHLADQRYEVRDTQYLAGLLVDQGYARPGIAVSGESYGGGQSLELAVLKNRMELPNGRLVPFVSPRRHVPMTVAAVYALWPWDDLVTALLPNGRLSSTGVTSAKDDRDPPGVAKLQWDEVLYAASANLGYTAPVGADPQADITAGQYAMLAGEPFSTSEIASLAVVQRYKSAIGIPMPKGGPAPTAIQSGFTDTLFPVDEALHYANAVRATRAKTPVLLVFDDVGHPWAQNKAADIALNDLTGIAFLNDVVLNDKAPPTGVLVRAQNCPKSAPSGAPASAPTFGALQKGAARMTGTGSQQVTSAGGDPAVAAALDGVVWPLCNPLPAATEPGTASYSIAAGTRGLHVLGGVRISATLAVTGNYPELVARLWDAPRGGATRQIVEMGVYRPAVNQEPGTPTTASGVESISFQLPPNDYVVASGHTLELELVGSNAPFYRPSNGTFTITVSNLVATVPLA